MKPCPRNWLPVAAVFALTLALFDGVAQPKVSGRVRDFSAPTTDSKGKRSVLKGTDARHLGNEIYEIVSPRVTTYNADDTVDMVIESPRCEYDHVKKLVSSPAELSVRTGGERFSIQGVGWFLDRGQSLLIISNRIEALIQKTVLSEESATNSARKARMASEAPVRVTSEFFTHQAEEAIFNRNVIVRDGPDTLSCALLRALFRKGGGVRQVEAEGNVRLIQGDTEARGGKGFYSLDDNLIRLVDKTSWKAGERSGSSEVLVLNRSNNTFHAEQSVYMKLPVTNSVAANTNAAPVVTSKTPGETNRFIEVFSDLFDLTPGASTNDPTTAVYRGNVRAVRGQDEIRSRTLTVLFSNPDNKLLRVAASEQVEVIAQKNRAFGDEAVYEVADERITLTGNPRWDLEGRTGSSETIVFFPRTEELLALRSVRMVLPQESLGGVELFGSRTNGTASRAKGPVVISADSFSRQGSMSVFQDSVKVEDPASTLTCQLLTVQTGASNQVMRMVGTTDVLLTQTNLVARGSRVEYNPTDSKLVLFGEPARITSPDRNVAADSFVIDRREGSFKIRGKYRIDMKPSEKKKAGLPQPAPETLSFHARQH